MIISECAVDLLIYAREQVADVVRDDPTRKSQWRHCIGRVLTNADPDWRQRPATLVACGVEVLEELDLFFRHVRSTCGELKTAESRTRSALRALGYDLPNGHGTRPSSPAWAAYLASCSRPQVEMNIFADICTRNTLEPPDVTNATLVQHQFALLKRRPQASVDTSLRRIVKCLRDTPPTGRTAADFEMPGVVIGYRRRTDLLPAAVADTEAWATYRQRGDAALTPVGEEIALREAQILQHLLSALDNPHSIGLEHLLELPNARTAVERTAARLRAREVGHSQAMAYDGARILSRMARCHFLASLGRASLPKSVIGGLDELATNYAPQVDKLLPLRIRNILRKFRKRQQIERFWNLPETLGQDLIQEDTLAFHDQRRLTVACALRLAMEVPERSDLLAGLPTTAIRKSAEGNDTGYHVFRATCAYEADDVPIGELSPKAVRLHNAFLRLVRNVHPDAALPHLFLGRGQHRMSATWFRQQLVTVTKQHLDVGLSVRDIRWVMAFVTLVIDPTARDLAAGYLGHKRKAYIEPLLRLVAEWKNSGAIRVTAHAPIGPASPGAV